MTRNEANVVSDLKKILNSNLVYLIDNAKNFNEQIERWDAIKDADLVEVVRCKDCAHLVEKDDWNDCDVHNIWIEDVNSYCSYGERREDERLNKQTGCHDRRGD